MPTAGTPRAARWSSAGLALLSVLVYANGLANGFAFDDESIVARNEYVHHGGRYLRQLLLGSWWPDSRELYRPVTLSSLALDWTLGGGSPAWFHAVNALLHAAVAVLLLRLLLRLGAPLAAAVAGAALFAVHPVHVEAVANVVGRGEVLATLFVLLACLVHLHRSRPAPLRLGAVLVLYLLAMGSKEIAVTLPALLLALDAFQERETGFRPAALLRARIPLLAGMTAALALYLVVRRGVLGEVTGTGSAPYLFGLPAVDRAAVAFRLWPEYVRLLAWPADLAADWGPGTIQVATWTSPLAWLGVAIAAGLLLLARADWRRGGGWGALAVAWFAFAILPVSQLLFPIGTMLAERTLYLPSVALAFVPAALSPAWRAQPRLALAAVCAAVLLLGARTWTRTPVWRSTATVWEDLARHHPESWKWVWQRAQMEERRGNPRQALALYLHAVQQVNANGYLLNTAAAQLLLRFGHAAEAEVLLRRAIAREPDQVPAPAVLASVLIDQGRDADVLRLTGQVMASHPRGSDVRGLMHHLSALALDRLGRTDEARARNDSALAEPGSQVRARSWVHHARLEHVRGHDAAAAAALDSARRLDPGLPAMDPHDPPGADSPLVRGWGDLTPAPAPPPPHPAATSLLRAAP